MNAPYRTYVPKVVEVTVPLFCDPEPCPYDPTVVKPYGYYHVCPACDCVVIAGRRHRPHSTGCTL